MVDIDPWGSNQIEDYAKLFDQFGIQKFSDLIGMVQKPHRLMRRHVIFGHRDGDKFFETMIKKDPCALVTGLMPSGKMHFGHKMVVDEVKWFQAQGVPVYIAIASVEAYSVREKSMVEVQDLGINEYLLNYIALGLKPENCEVYFQEKRRAVTSLAPLFSRRITFNELKAIYGDLSPAKIEAALIQVADILHPQIEEFGGPKPIIVPVGADQDPHIRLTRDIASRYFSEYGFISPSATYHKFISGLNGGKMSSSSPNSYIALTDTIEDANRKMSNAFTGGRDTKAEQKEKGGQPNICTIYEFMKIHLMDDDGQLAKIYSQCVSGELMCGPCKKIAKDLLTKFLTDHQEKREKAKDKIDDYLVRE